MTSTAFAAQAAMLGSALGYGILSAIVPFMNAEVYVVGATALVPSQLWPALLVLFTIGTMLGKGFIFVSAERLTNRAAPKVRVRIDRAVAMLERRPAATWPIVFVSALVGLPPFYAVTVAGGVLRLGVVSFLVVGGAGRLLRFATLMYGMSLWPWSRA